MLKIKSNEALSEAILVLKKGGVVICPTDTVYGFLADAGSKKAVGKIYKIKRRPQSKPLPIFVKDFKMARQLAQINEEQAKMLKKYWPGKYTFVLQTKNGTGTIALRIPKDTFLHKLLKIINRPLVQTSVNISGEKELKKVQDIKEKFQKKVDLIVDGGDLAKSKPSRIIDLSKSKIEVIRN